jgi:pimeloyl-ACP methyl ester carboxylesterase
LLFSVFHAFLFSEKPALLFSVYICPPKYAYILHRNLPGSKLIITEKAGHIMSEGPTQAELVKAMKELEVISDSRYDL